MMKKPFCDLSFERRQPYGGFCAVSLFLLEAKGTPPRVEVGEIIGQHR